MVLKSRHEKYLKNIVIKLSCFGPTQVSLYNRETFNLFYEFSFSEIATTSKDIIVELS